MWHSLSQAVLCSYSRVFYIFMYLQFSSVSQSCPTLCDPMDCSTPGFPVHHQLPKLAHVSYLHFKWLKNAFCLNMLSLQYPCSFFFFNCCNPSSIVIVIIISASWGGQFFAWWKLACWNCKWILCLQTFLRTCIVLEKLCVEAGELIFVLGQCQHPRHSWRRGEASSELADVCALLSWRVVKPMSFFLCPRSCSVGA